MFWFIFVLLTFCWTLKWLKAYDMCLTCLCSGMYCVQLVCLESVTVAYGPKSCFTIEAWISSYEVLSFHVKLKQPLYLSTCCSKVVSHLRIQRSVRLLKDNGLRYTQTLLHYCAMQWPNVTPCLTVKGRNTSCQVRTMHNYVIIYTCNTLAPTYTLQVHEGIVRNWLNVCCNIVL